MKINLPETRKGRAILATVAAVVIFTLLMFLLIISGGGTLAMALKVASQALLFSAFTITLIVGANRLVEWVVQGRKS